MSKSFCSTYPVFLGHERDQIEAKRENQCQGAVPVHDVDFVVETAETHKEILRSQWNITFMMKHYDHN